jgi:hypothetical protein
MPFATANVLGGGNATLTHSGLAAGTTSTTTFLATTYRIGEKTYTKAAGTNTTTPTTDAVTGVAFLPVNIGQACLFMFGFNAAGTFQCIQGPRVSLNDYLGKLTALPLPNLPETFCAIGYEIIQVGPTGSAWTMGTNNQSGVTGVTYTFVPTCFPPSQPVSA